MAPNKTLMHTSCNSDAAIKYKQHLHRLACTHIVKSDQIEPCAHNYEPMDGRLNPIDRYGWFVCPVCRIFGKPWESDGDPRANREPRREGRVMTLIEAKKFKDPTELLDDFIWRAEKSEQQSVLARPRDEAKDAIVFSHAPSASSLLPVSLRNEAKDATITSGAPLVSDSSANPNDANSASVVPVRGVNKERRPRIVGELAKLAPHNAPFNQDKEAGPVYKNGKKQDRETTFENAMPNRKPYWDDMGDPGSRRDRARRQK